MMKLTIARIVAGIGYIAAQNSGEQSDAWAGARAAIRTGPIGKSRGAPFPACPFLWPTRPVPCVTPSITEMGLDCRHDGRWHMNIVILTETPYKYPSLTGDMLFRLWKAAIKDDDTLANEVIRGIYDGMMAFDRERAEDVMDLTVRRHPTSRDAFRALLKDMQVFRS